MRKAAGRQLRKAFSSFVSSRASPSRPNSVAGIFDECVGHALYPNDPAPSQPSGQECPLHTGKNALAFAGAFYKNKRSLELVPQILVVDLMMELHLRSFYESPESASAAVRGGLFQVGIAAFDIFAEQGFRPIGFAEVFDCRVNVVRQVTLRLAQVLDLRGLAIQAGLEDREHDHIRIGVGCDGANFDAHTFLVADRNADHRTAIDCGGFDLVWCLKVRIEAAIRIDTGIEQQADVVAVSQNSIAKTPAHLAQLFFTLRIPKKILALVADRNVGVHAAPVYAHNRLGQKRRGESHVGCDLAADQLVNLNLIGGGDDFAVSVVDFEL